MIALLKEGNNVYLTNKITPNNIQLYTKSFNTSLFIGSPNARFRSNYTWLDLGLQCRVCCNSRPIYQPFT